MNKTENDERDLPYQVLKEIMKTTVTKTMWYWHQKREISEAVEKSTGTTG